MELRHIQEMQELRSSLEKQEYFTFSQAARLMGVSRQYIYKLVKEDKLRASRISGRMALVRRADIELMLKSKPYERLVAKNDFDITEYYTAEEIAEKYKVNAKWVWTYTRQHKVPKVRIRQFNYYSKKHIDAAFAKYEVDSDLTEWYTPEDIQEGAWADILLQAPLRPLEEFRTGEQGGILYRQGGNGEIQALSWFGLRYSAIPSDQPWEERTVRQIPESGVWPGNGCPQIV